MTEDCNHDYVADLELNKNCAGLGYGVLVLHTCLICQKEFVTFEPEGTYNKIIPENQKFYIKKIKSSKDAVNI